MEKCFKNEVVPECDNNRCWNVFGVIEIQVWGFLEGFRGGVRPRGRACTGRRVRLGADRETT